MTAGIQTPKAASSDFISGDRVIVNQYLQSSLKQLSEADPADVQTIAASQIRLLATYYELVRDQSRQSFRWALVAAIAGCIFFLSALTFVITRQLESAATISLISVALIELISGINFYLYGKTTNQLGDFQTRLDWTQRYLLANSIIESMEGEHKQLSRADLVRVIVGAAPANALAAVNPAK
jgi:hypothetical protein